MGRKPIGFTTKLQQKLESASLSYEHQSNNLPSEKLELRTETIIPPSPLLANPTKSTSRRMAKKTLKSVRRSERLHNSVVCPQNLNIEHVIEEITLTESEKEDGPVDLNLPGPKEPTLDGKNLEEKFDNLLQLFAAQQKSIDALQSKTGKKNLFGENSGASDVTYKSLYIDSQKKVEALMEQNLQLSKKLENALGKIEVYEKGNHAVSGVLEKLKDMILFSTLTRTTEAAANISSEAVRGAFTALDNNAAVEARTSPKRKRLLKDTRN